MNFTREPIIETVITPREGCKLVVRSSKGSTQEDYYVDAVEVVSFGHSFFFRSQERPKSFLVPVSDYEILELKETRMVLKNVTTDRSIKIGGGRDAQPKPREESLPQDAALLESRPAPQQQPEMRDRKRDKRRRGRRGRDRERSEQDLREREPRQVQEKADFPDEDLQLSDGPYPEQGTPEGVPGEEKAPSFISKLFPPPTTLIKESLGRYKPVESEEEESGFEEIEPLNKLEKDADTEEEE